MSEESDITSRRRPRLSKLSVLALLSSVPCIAVVGVVYDLLPLRHAFVLPYLWLIDLVARVLWGAQISRSAGLTEALVLPSLIFLTVSPAIALGIAGTIRIDRSRGRLKGVSLGMAAVGVAMNCSLLTSPLLLQDIGKAREAFRLVRIEGSEKKRRACILAVGAALQSYVDFHEDGFPDSGGWCDTLVKGHYLDDQPQLLWLAGRRRWPCAINPDCGPDSTGETVLLFETYPAWNRRGGPELLSFSIQGDARVNVFLKNGELKTVTRNSVRALLWK